MKLNFCIIAGINYLAKAITMYESLVDTGVDFSLYYVAFDNKTYKCLKTLNYEHIIPISLSEVEDKELKEAKKNRKESEYYFTLTPAIILYIIRCFNLKQCIYIDADLYFFQSPELLLAEMETKSVMITKHHPLLDVIHKEGKYCVQFIPFNNDRSGMEVLEWWRAKCLEWCYLKAEDGKWADQGYLNDWPERFSNIHVLKHLGAVGPWNMADTRNFYKIINQNGKPHGLVTETEDIFPVVFFHFQGLRVRHNYEVSMATAEVPDSFERHIYKPYIEHLFKVNSRIQMISPGADVLGKLPKPRTISSLLDIIAKEKTIRNIASSIIHKLHNLIKVVFVNRFCIL